MFRRWYNLHLICCRFSHNSTDSAAFIVCYHSLINHWVSTCRWLLPLRLVLLLLWSWAVQVHPGFKFFVVAPSSVHYNGLIMSLEAELLFPAKYEFSASGWANQLFAIRHHYFMSMVFQCVVGKWVKLLIQLDLIISEGFFLWFLHQWIHIFRCVWTTQWTQCNQWTEVSVSAACRCNISSYSLEMVGTLASSLSTWGKRENEFFFISLCNLSGQIWPWALEQHSSTVSADRDGFCGSDIKT